MMASTSGVGNDNNAFNAGGTRNNNRNKDSLDRLARAHLLATDDQWNVDDLRQHRVQGLLE